MKLKSRTKSEGGQYLSLRSLDHSDPGVTHRTHISIEDLITMILLLLLTATSLVTPGRAFHLPEGQGAAHTGTPHTCQVDSSQSSITIKRCIKLGSAMMNILSQKYISILFVYLFIDQCFRRVTIKSGCVWRSQSANQ